MFAITNDNYTSIYYILYLRIGFLGFACKFSMKVRLGSYKIHGNIHILILGSRIPQIQEKHKMSSEYMKFNSRRSTVYSSKGMIASSQALANQAGIKVLEKGGNCVDAAIAVSAALCVVEPTSTGIGGDCFSMYYKKDTKEIFGLNGTGRSAKNLTVQNIFDHHNDGKPILRIPIESAFTVNVPGAVAGWIDTLDNWGSGKVTLKDILDPAISLAEGGFPVCEIASKLWSVCEGKLKRQNPDHKLIEGTFLFNNKTPKEGDFVQNKPIAKVFRSIIEGGKDGFYKGPVAEAIIRETKLRDHKLDLEDLTDHTSTIIKPINIAFENYKIWEIPPSGQGLVALLALGIIQQLHNTGVIDLYKMKHNSPEYLHVLIEACKLGFYDSDEYVTDPEFDHIPLDDLLNEAYLQERAKLFRKDKILDSETIKHGVPDPKYKSDTVYLAVTDSNGDACSFINSVYDGFGSGIAVPEYGFCLHNRGANFNLTEGLKNCFSGKKRPYHTIIPSMITRTEDDSLFAAFGNMGGYMQPVGQVQHVLNLCIFGFTPQQLIDLPRFCLNASKDITTTDDRGRGSDGPVSTPVTVVSLEEGIDQNTIDELSKLGHTTKLVTGYDRELFGRAQIIKDQSKDDQLIFAGGSDLRGDGSATPYY